MTPDLWAELKSAFESARELDANARKAVVGEACGDDARLLEALR
jgi:hypothetical protein